MGVSKVKKTIIIVSSFLGLIALFFMIEYFASPVKDVTSKAEMKMTTGAKMEYVPTKDELVKLKEINFNYWAFTQ